MRGFDGIVEWRAIFLSGVQATSGSAEIGFEIGVPGFAAVTNRISTDPHPAQFIRFKVRAESCGFFREEERQRGAGAVAVAVAVAVAQKVALYCAECRFVKLRSRDKVASV